MAKFLSKYGIIFDAVWTEFIDEQFFSWMQTEAIFHKRIITSDDAGIMSTIADWMYMYVDTPFTLEYIYDRFELATLRFQTWKALTSFTGVQYDEGTLSITTTPAVWEIICEEFILGTHYRHYPMERMWHELNSMFGPDAARRSSFIAMLPPKPTRSFPIKADPLPLRVSTLPNIDDLLCDYEQEDRAWNLQKKGKAKATVSPPTSQFPFDQESSTKGKGRIIPSFNLPYKETTMQDEEITDSNADEETWKISVWPTRNAKRNLHL